MCMWETDVRQIFGKSIEKQFILICKFNITPVRATPHYLNIVLQQPTELSKYISGVTSGQKRKGDFDFAGGWCSWGICIAFYGDMKSKTFTKQNPVVWLFVQSTQELDCLSIPSTVWSLHKGCLEMAHPAVQLVSCTKQSIRRKDQQEKVYLNKVLASLQCLCLILCCCRCRLLPLHRRRDMVL